MFSGEWGLIDYLLLIAFVVGAVAAGLYFLNRWAGKRMADQQDIIEKTKQTVSMYIIDKKKAKASEANFPKAVMANMPKWYKFMKLPLVKAKVGPQILTLLCDKKVFVALPVKKNVKVELAGIYILGMKGMKSAQEMKERERGKAQKKPLLPFLKK